MHSSASLDVLDNSSNDGHPLAPPPPPRSLTERLGYLALRLAGWRVVGVRPTAPKYLMIVAPHTSNWDFWVGLACGYGAGLLSR